MRARFWGSRGSLAAPGPDTVRTGGNTSCIEVRPADGSLVILDSGTGIRALGGSIDGQNSSRALSTVAPSPAQAAAGCNILNLVLGPLDLNLLGLAVHLDQVVLDITAVPGAGNLLGNLLCAVANLLNGLNLNLLGGALLNTLTQLLNNLVGALAGL